MNKHYPYDKHVNYIKSNELNKVINFQKINEINENNENEPIPPDLDDLVRLHKIIRKRKCRTILEFGVGYSTVIMADALKKKQ